jgi:hypothetical protein
MDALTQLLGQFTSVLGMLNALGVPGCLLLFIVGLIRKWWVLGSFHHDQEKRIERLEGKVDDWKSIALTSLSTGDRLADHALSRKR